LLAELLVERRGASFVDRDKKRGLVRKKLLTQSSRIRVAVVESDPLRFAGLKAVLDSPAGLELIAMSLAEVGVHDGINVVVVGCRDTRSMLQEVEVLRTIRPDLRILVTGPERSEAKILDVLLLGAKGYIEESAHVEDFLKAIQVVSEGLMWVPRRVFAMFIDRVGDPALRRRILTDREREVLDLLVAGCSNKEIGSQLDIEERTVKAHVSKLMRKTGVQNRVMLSVHAVNRCLVALR
jgi:DNA-binding NarL/FixJ family response regulator